MAILGSPPSKWKINTDGDILPKKSTANLRIENTAPTFLLRETDQALPNGLWRLRLDDNALFIERNTAVAGDFSSLFEHLVVSTAGDGIVQARSAVNVTGTNPHFRIVGTASVGSLSVRSIFVASGRLHFLDDVATDETLASTVDSINHRISSTNPRFELRDTDFAVNVLGGLWAVDINQASGNLQFHRNAAVAGDFSTSAVPLEIGDNGIGAGSGALLDTWLSLNYLQFGSANAVASVGGGPGFVNIFRSNLDNRLHIKDNAGADKTIAYTDEIVSPGNTVLVSEYVTKDPPTGAIDGINAVFTLAFTPELGTEEVYLNGIQQDPGGANDYTIVGDTITFNSAPLATDKIRVSYIK